MGLGANTPINTGNESEALLALEDRRWVNLRVPLPGTTSTVLHFQLRPDPLAR